METAKISRKFWYGFKLIWWSLKNDAPKSFKYGLKERILQFVMLSQKYDYLINLFQELGGFFKGSNIPTTGQKR